MFEGERGFLRDGRQRAEETALVNRRFVILPHDFVRAENFYCCTSYLCIYHGRTGTLLFSFLLRFFRQKIPARSPSRIASGKNMHTHIHTPTHAHTRTHTHIQTHKKQKQKKRNQPPPLTRRPTETGTTSSPCRPSNPRRPPRTPRGETHPWPNPPTPPRQLPRNPPTIQNGLAMTALPPPPTRDARFSCRVYPSVP